MAEAFASAIACRCRSKFTVVVGALFRDRRNDVPVFGDLSVLDAPEIIKAGGRICTDRAHIAFGHGEHKVALREHHVRLVVAHLLSRFGELAERFRQGGHAVGNARIVLDIIVSVKVARHIAEIVAHHHVL